MVTFGMLFAGAVSAQGPATVDVAVINESGDNVTVAHPGDEVAADVVASANDEAVPVPFVQITVDPKTGLQFEPGKAMMRLNGGPVITNDMTNYPNNAFFFFDAVSQSWIWDVSYGMNLISPGKINMAPEDVVELIAPGIVGATGDITVDAELFGVPEDDPVSIAEDNYTFLSVAPEPKPSSANAATVPMQDTGAPLALAALGLLGIIGGAVYSKLK